VSSNSTKIQNIAQAICRMVYGVALVFLLWGLSETLHTASPRQTLLQADLTIPAGASVVLGRHELAAPAADSQHLRISHGATGIWSLSNLSHSKAVEVRRDGKDQLLRTAPMQSGQTFAVGSEQWTVLSIAPKFEFKQNSTGIVWAFDGAILRGANGVDNPPCPGATIQQKLRRLWNKTVPRPLQRPVRLEWGGSVACDSHLPQASIAAGEVWVTRDGAGYSLRASADAARRVCPQAALGTPCSPGASLFEQVVPLNNVTRLVVGRSQFGVAIQQDKLTLSALERTQWLALDAAPPLVPIVDSSVAEDAKLQWSLAHEDLWHWPLPMSPALTLAMAVLATAVMAAYFHVRRWGFTQPQALGVAAAAVTTLISFASFLLAVSGHPLGIALCLAQVCVALALVMLLPTQSLWVWGSYALMALMLVAGLAAQLQLGLQALDIGGWKFLQKTSALASTALFGCFTLALLMSSVQRGNKRIKAWRGDTLEWALAILAVLALMMLALEAVFGDESGVFGIQPVEFSKLALVMMSAHVLALRLNWNHHGGWRRWTLWARFILPIAIFVALGAIALLLVRDYSPLVLMAGWLVGAMVAWSVASSRMEGVLLAAVLSGATLMVAIWTHGDGVQWMQDHGFYGDRFAVWANAAMHPHSGEQYLRATRVLTQGGWRGDINAPAWRIPAVQDDMAPAFFTGRFGARAACALLLVQLCYIGCLLMLGWRALGVAALGDDKGRWLARLVFFAAWGYAFLFAGHLVLSWGTNYGFLPIMGQPMPLLSAGGSIIMMLMAPMQALWLVPLHKPPSGVN